LSKKQCGKNRGHEEVGLKETGVTNGQTIALIPTAASFCNEGKTINLKKKEERRGCGETNRPETVQKKHPRLQDGDPRDAVQKD